MLACTITLNNLSQTYNGLAAMVSVSTNPTNVPVAVTYNGSPSPPTNAGSYTVIATVVSSTYTGAATNTLTILPAPATITLGNLAQTYSGTAQSVTVTTTPSNLVCAITYNGSSGAPTNAGSYTVVGMIVNSNYMGSATNSLTISQAVATITFGGLLQTYNGMAKSVTVTTTPSNLVSTVTYNGSSVVPANAGSYTVVGTIVNSNYMGSATNILRISKAVATIVFGDLSQTYNGGAKSVTVTTTPSNLACAITYNGLSAAPIKIGTYIVVGTIVNSNYTGSATNTLTIRRASKIRDLTDTGALAGANVKALVQVSNLIQAYTGNPCSAAVATVPPGLNVTVTYDGTNQAPCDIGSYTVVASINDTNYSGTVTSILTIKPVSPPSSLVIVSWSSASGDVTLLESSNLVDWVTNTEPTNVESACSDSSGTTATAVSGQSGGHFFRALSDGVGIPLTIQQ